YYEEPKRAFDNNFKIETQTYENKADFLLESALKTGLPDGPADMTAEIRYNVCDATRCLPPAKRTATASLKIDSKATPFAVSIPPGLLECNPGAPVSSSPLQPPQQEGIGGFLLVAFSSGLLAIFTPCVFPMIPITMSFFLNKESAARRDAVFQAGLFCLGII